MKEAECECVKEGQEAGNLGLFVVYCVVHERISIVRREDMRGEVQLLLKI